MLVPTLLLPEFLLLDFCPGFLPLILGLDSSSSFLHLFHHLFPILTVSSLPGMRVWEGEHGLEVFRLEPPQERGWPGGKVFLTCLEQSLVSCFSTDTALAPGYQQPAVLATDPVLAPCSLLLFLLALGLL